MPSGSNHWSGSPRTALVVVYPGARLGRSKPWPGPIDGDQRERERLAPTNSVSGGPERSCPIAAICQPARSARAAPVASLPSGRSQTMFPTQLWVVW